MRLVRVLCIGALVGAWGTSPPVPDAALLAYINKKVGALVCYNMATMDHSQGCPPFHVPNRSTWDAQIPGTPAALDAATDQWASAIASFGGKYATLVAKHLCGFAIWPTRASLPVSSSRKTPFQYEYHSKMDVVGSFLRACQKHGIGLGIYYSVNANEYLNYHNGVRNASTLQPGQESVTQAEYVDIALQQLEELWSNYGSLSEIWFDGGYNQPGLLNRTRELLQQKQPGVPVFGGCGLTPNAVGWIGTESGHATYPVWDSADSCADITHHGNPDGSQMFLPYEVDLTLQNSDTWFYQTGMGYRSLREMISIYHDSVGLGGNMLLNVAPPPNGSLPTEAVALYKELGSFVNACYGDQNARQATRKGQGTFFQIHLPNGSAPVNRFVVEEDLSTGQRILEFVVDATLADGTTQRLFNGTAVGRTLIHLLPSPIDNAVSLNLHVLRSRGQPTVATFNTPGPVACIVAPSPASQCHEVNGTSFNGPVFETHPPGTGYNTPQACCTRCSLFDSCAVFTLHANKTCELLTAQTGTVPELGATSGSWR